MERDLDDLYKDPNETAPAFQRSGPPWQQEQETAGTTPSIDTWSEQPTMRLSSPGAQLPVWPASDEPSAGLWQRIKQASRRAQLGLVFGSLLFLFFFAVLIAGALSSGGVLRLPGKGSPLGPSIQIWPSVFATPTPQLIPQGPGAPTATPNRGGGTGAGGGPGSPPSAPTATPHPAGTATPGPTPTPTTVPIPTPTTTPVPQPTATDTPVPQPTATDTPAPTPTDTP